MFKGAQLIASMLNSTNILGIFTVEKQNQVGENHQAPASCLVPAALHIIPNDSQLNLCYDAAARTPHTEGVGSTELQLEL